MNCLNTTKVYLNLIKIAPSINTRNKLKVVSSQAITDYSMICNGDRVLVCLSGGKDSLSLLHTLRQYQHYARGTHGISFTLGAATVDPLSAAYDPRPLIPYLASLGVPYLYERQGMCLSCAINSLRVFLEV